MISLALRQGSRDAAPPVTAFGGNFRALLPVAGGMPAL